MCYIKPFYITHYDDLYRLFYVNPSKNDDIYTPVIEFKSLHDYQYQQLCELIKHNYELLIILEYKDLIQWFQVNFCAEDSVPYYSFLEDTGFCKIIDGMNRK